MAELKAAAFPRTSGNFGIEGIIATFFYLLAEGVRFRGCTLTVQIFNRVVSSVALLKNNVNKIAVNIITIIIIIADRLEAQALSSVTEGGDHRSAMPSRSLELGLDPAIASPDGECTTRPRARWFQRRLAPIRSTRFGVRPRRLETGKRLIPVRRSSGDRGDRCE